MRRRARLPREVGAGLFGNLLECSHEQLLFNAEEVASRSFEAF